VLVGIGLLLLILAVPAYSYYQTYVAPLQEVVVRVNDTRFTLGDYIKRLRFLDLESAMTGVPVDYSVDPFRLLQDLQNNELIRVAIPRLGISVTDEELGRALRERLQALPQAGEQVTPAELDRTFNERYKQHLNQLKLSDAEYREIVRETIRKDKLRELLSVRVPAVAEQVRLLGMKLPESAQTDEVVKRLQKGEDFGAVARELSADPDTKDNRGDMGWVPRRAYDAAFDKVAFSTPIGATSEPFFVDRGFWIIKVLEHADTRIVEGTAKEKLKDRALVDWLSEEQKANQVESFFDSERYAVVVNKAREYRNTNNTVGLPGA
jgi:parvulin-like peptidyl-prolyl isomerase